MEYSAFFSAVLSEDKVSGKLGGRGSAFVSSQSLTARTHCTNSTV